MNPRNFGHTKNVKFLKSRREGQLKSASLSTRLNIAAA